MVGLINFPMRDNFSKQDRLFYYALVFSTALHLIFFSGLFIYKFKNVRKPSQDIVVNYVSVKPQEATVNKAGYKDIKVVKNKQTLPKVDILSSKKNTDDFVAKEVKDVSKFAKNFELDKKQMPQIRTLDVDSTIKIPALKSEKITNPQYLSYNESIRQRIKQRAYQYINHPDFQAGSVYLTFVVKSDGTLQDIKIIEERTKANDYLRNIGLKSIRESNPFAPFPADLNYPELTFNVVMSFEVGK